MSVHDHSWLFKNLLVILAMFLVLFTSACEISVIESRTPGGESQVSAENESHSTVTGTEEISSVHTEPDSIESMSETDEARSSSEAQKTSETETEPVESMSSDPESTESVPETSEEKTTSEPTTTPEPETEPPVSETTKETHAPTTSEPATEPSSPVLGPHIPEGPVKNMLRQGLIWVSRSMGYSMEDRAGAGGHFDCSGLVAVLLRDALGETNIGWFGNDPWDTAYWRYFASQYGEGNRLTIGSVVYEVHFRESYDFSHAWEVPGSIVVQYPPENDPSTKSGHISLALGTIPYESTTDVINYISEEYGVNLSGITGNNGNIPMVYDPNGAGSGHVTWKINANGVAKATCVDNNYCNDPSWIERISAVFIPVE